MLIADYLNTPYGVRQRVSRANGVDVFKPVLLSYASGSPKCVGSGISLEEWRKMLSFFSAMYKKNRGETMARIFRDENGKMVFYPLEQHASFSMTVKETESDAKYAKIAELLSKGWTEIGSIHHHCSSSAFASDTDIRSESSGVEGLHITIGHMDSPEIDVHVRYYSAEEGAEKKMYGISIPETDKTHVRGVLTEWQSFFDFGEDLEEYVHMTLESLGFLGYEEPEVADTEKKIRGLVFRRLFLHNPKDDEPCHPPEWESAVVRPSYGTWASPITSPRGRNLFSKQDEFGSSTFFPQDREQKDPSLYTQADMVGYPDYWRRIRPLHEDDDDDFLSRRGIYEDE